MQRHRTSYTGERHPTLDEPTPLDMCGWCAGWIAEQENRGFVRLAGLSRDHAEAPFATVMIDDHLTTALVPANPAELGLDPGDAVVVLCSEQCEAALMEATARHKRRSEGEDGPRRTPTAHERDDAEALLQDHCAWCLRHIGDDDPIETVSAALTGPVDEDARFISVDIAGRPVHAVRPPPGFPMTEGHQILFVVCSKACAEVLILSSRTTRALRIPH